MPLPTVWSQLATFPTAGRPPRRRERLAAAEDVQRGGSVAPLRALALVEHEREPVAELRVEPVDDARVEEEPRRKRVGKDKPDGRHGPVRAPSASATRSAI